MWKKTTDVPHVPPTTLPKNAAIAKLERDVGAIGRLGVNHSTRKDLSDSLKELKREEAHCLQRAGTAAMRIAEGNLMGALVNHGVAAISQLTAENHRLTGASIANITASMGAERIAHVNNRTAQFQALHARLVRKELTEEEVAALRSHADADLAADIDAANRRGERNKAAIENLSAMALSGLRIPLRNPGEDA